MTSIIRNPRAHRTARSERTCPCRNLNIRSVYHDRMSGRVVHMVRASACGRARRGDDFTSDWAAVRCPECHQRRPAPRASCIQCHRPVDGHLPTSGTARLQASFPLSAGFRALPPGSVPPQRLPWPLRAGALFEVRRSRARSWTRLQGGSVIPLPAAAPGRFREEVTGGQLTVVIGQYDACLPPRRA
jgi:hypothetical protein